MSSVDVVVPCYKYGHYLRQCTDSLLSQSGVDVRILIIDDASPDDTAVVAAELAREDRRVHFRRHDANRGHIATFNEGVAWVSADYMLLISADDYLLPGALARAAELMDLHPNVTLAFGRALELSATGATRPFLTSLSKYDDADVSIVPGPEFIEVSTFQNRVPTPTAVVRTSVLKEVGGYHLELPHTGDMEMWLRLAAYGSVGIIGACQAVYRRHEANMSLTYFNTYLPDLQQRKKAFDCFINSCGHRLSNVSRLQDRTYRGLAVEAVDRAHAAFDQGEGDLCRALGNFATEVYPPVRRSLRWVKLGAKQMIGLKSVGTLKTICSVPSRNVR